MTSSEAEILAAIRLAIGHDAPHARLFRNSQGVAWVGETVRIDGNTVLLRRARRVRYVLAEGASDLIGLVQVVVTPDMVGQTVALFVAGEVKRPGESVPEPQRNFVEFVNRFGGRAAVLRSVDDALKLVRP